MWVLQRHTTTDADNNILQNAYRHTNTITRCLLTYTHEKPAASMYAEILSVLLLSAPSPSLEKMNRPTFFFVFWSSSSSIISVRNGHTCLFPGAAKEIIFWLHRYSKADLSIGMCVCPWIERACVRVSLMCQCVCVRVCARARFCACKMNLRVDDMF